MLRACEKKPVILSVAKHLSTDIKAFSVAKNPPARVIFVPSVAAVFNRQKSNLKSPNLRR